MTPAASEDRPRRGQQSPTYVEAVAVWLLRGADGIGGLLAVAVGVSVFGFIFFPGDLADRHRAEMVAAQGRWASVTDVQVRVQWVGGKGGGYYEVGAVKVSIPGSAGPVPLDNLEGDSVEEVTAKEGWQQPSSETGYQPPLPVRFVVNARGEVDAAIAENDLAYWTANNNDPEVGLALGFAGLGVALAALAINSIRLAPRPHRPRMRRQARASHHACDRIQSTGRRGHGSNPQRRNRPERAGGTR